MQNVSMSCLSCSLKCLSIIKYIIGFPKWLIKYAYTTTKVLTIPKRSKTAGKNDITKSKDIEINILIILVSRLSIFLSFTSLQRRDVVPKFKCRVFTGGTCNVFESVDSFCVINVCTCNLQMLL